MPTLSRRTVLHTIIQLCHQLGIAVTAEGIETPDHERVLRELGCDQGQGYHFARPAHAGSIAEMLG
jgi:EAL domain-containing protein (putative c-di-GMP-specific phosphodiesterase class I)